MNEQKVQLFLSFGFLLNEFRRGIIPVELFDSALFAFQCKRKDVFDDEIVGERYIALRKSDTEENWRILRDILRPAFLKAEQENRILWRGEEERGLSFEKINKFLEAHGLSQAIRYAWLEIPSNKVQLYPNGFKHFFAKSI